MITRHFWKSRAKRVTLGFCLIAILAIAAIIAVLARYFWTEPNTINMRRFIDISTIKEALVEYFRDHGALPDRLSSLCPNYVSIDRLDVWFPTRDTRVMRLPGPLKEVSRIDENCDYLYFPRIPVILKDLPYRALQIILCERPYPRTAKTAFAVVFNDLSMDIRSRRDIEELLSRTVEASEWPKAALPPQENPNANRTIITLKREDIP